MVYVTAVINSSTSNACPRNETVLTSDMESNRVLALSFWKKKSDAERYHREQYPKINEMLLPHS